MTDQQIRKLVAVLPALNEAKTIASVVVSLREYGDVVVIDDGSTDDTAAQARTAGAIVVSHALNRGYDQALESGLLWAATQGYQYAITLDADGQHSASSICLFTRAFDAGADLVVGIRDCRQRWAEMFFSSVSTLLWNIRDPLCGMKGYRLDLLRAEGRFASYSSIGTEFCIKAARSNCVICQVRVPILSRNGASRFGGGLLPNLRIIKALILGIFRASPLSGI